MQRRANHLSSPSSMAVKIALSHAFIARPIFTSSNCGAKVEASSSHNQRAAIGMKMRWRELRIGWGLACGWIVEELTEVNVRRGEVDMVFRTERALKRELVLLTRRRDNVTKFRVLFLIRSGGGGMRLLGLLR